MLKLYWLKGTIAILFIEINMWLIDSVMNLIQ